MTQKTINDTKTALIYRTIIVLLLTALAFTGHDELTKWGLMRDLTADNVVLEPKAPYAKEVRAIISPLRYSADSFFMDPKTTIVFDLKNRIWGMRGMHLFDPEGNVRLREGRYGICGDLAAYTYQKIRPIFPKDRFDIQFVRVAESSFFNLDGGTHIILSVLDKKSAPQPRIYFLDPSLRKYGSPDLFGTYLPKDSLESLPFVDYHYSDQYFFLDDGPPVHMNKREMISISVMGNDGKFDERNFTVILTLLKRYEYRNRPLVIYRTAEGRREIIDQTQNIGQMDSPADFGGFRKRFLELCDSIQFVVNPPLVPPVPAKVSSGTLTLAGLNAQNASLSTGR